MSTSPSGMLPLVTTVRVGGLGCEKWVRAVVVQDAAAGTTVRVGGLGWVVRSG